MQQDPRGHQGGVEADGGTCVDAPGRATSSTGCSTPAARGKLAGRRLLRLRRTASATGLWPGLTETFPETDDPASISLQDLEERMLFVEAIETVEVPRRGRASTSAADANIGSILGIGFPAWTGGVLQYVIVRATRPARRRRLRGPRPGARGEVRRALRAAGLAGREGRARGALQRRVLRAGGGLSRGGLRGGQGRAQRPVEPRPRAPRAVASSSPRPFSRTDGGVCRISSWATRSPGLISKGSASVFIRITMISPR